MSTIAKLISWPVAQDLKRASKKSSDNWMLTEHANTRRIAGGERGFSGRGQTAARQFEGFDVMSLLETGPASSRPKKQPRRKKQFTPPLDERLIKGRSDQILLFLEWCQLNRISASTGRRIIARGEVAVTRLSPKRIGISVGNNAKWQASRAREPTVA